MTVTIGTVLPGRVFKVDLTTMNVVDLPLTSAQRQRSTQLGPNSR